MIPHYQGAVQQDASHLTGSAVWDLFLLGETLKKLESGEKKPPLDRGKFECVSIWTDIRLGFL